MTIIYLSVYLIIILLIWGLYAVARMHSMKFKNFSTHIVPVTNLLLVILAILSILGFITIFSMSTWNNGYEIDTSSEYDKIEVSKENTPKKEKPEIVEKNYREDIIWDEYEYY